MDVPLKIARLKQWCEDINQAQSKAKYGFVYVDMEGFDKYKPTTFEQLIATFREYKVE